MDARHTVTVEEWGSLPPKAAIYGCVGKLVTPGDCKSSASRHYLFDSSHIHQYLSKVLSGCIRGLGPCGLGSNPSRETRFLWRGHVVMVATQTVTLIVWVRAPLVTPKKFKSHWCSGSIRVSKTLGCGSIP